MTNDKLPVEIERQIQQQAFSSVGELKAERKGASFCLGYEAGYNEGATAWARWFVKHNVIESELHGVRAENDRLKKSNQELQAQARRMADALEFIANSPVPANEREMVSWILTARALAVEQLQQFKDGKGDEEAPKEIEYMPILSAELRELKNIPSVPMRVPMHLLNERQAYSNHGQSLQRLKERGGLSVKESLALINCMPWMHYKYLPINEAVLLLNELITNPTK